MLHQKHHIFTEWPPVLRRIHVKIKDVWFWPIYSWSQFWIDFMILSWNVVISWSVKSYPRPWVDFMILSLNVEENWLTLSLVDFMTINWNVAKVWRKIICLETVYIRVKFILATWRVSFLPKTKIIYSAQYWPKSF